MGMVAFKQTLNIIKYALGKNAPTILTSVAVVGVITTIVTTIRATPKALDLLDEARRAKGQWGDTVSEIPMSPQEVIKSTWKCYIPVAISATLTIASILMTHKINQTRYAALLGLYTVSDVAFKEYKAKVRDTFGENKAQAVTDAIAADRVHQSPVDAKDKIVYGSGTTLCYETLTGRYFWSDIETIRRITNQKSRELMTEMFITVDEVYSELGLPPTDVAGWAGWDIDNGLIEASFSSQLTENSTPCLVLSFDTQPRYMQGH